MRNLLMIPLIGGLLLASSQADEKSQIAQIRKWYGEVENNKALKKTSYKTNEDETPHVGGLTRYETKAGELKKLIHDSYGEHGSSTVMFYFNNGKLFFVYEFTEEWRFTGEETAEGQSKTVTIGREYRYYFHNGKCIRALSKTVQTGDGGKVRKLLQKAKNELMAHHDTAPNLLRQAEAFSKMKSAEELEKYFSEP